MKAAGAAGLVWDEANLADYLRSPKVKVPGNRMAFAGLKREEDVVNVIAYLKANPKP
jgi:cytochrome c